MADATNTTNPPALKPCPWCRMPGRLRSNAATGESTVYCEAGDLHTANTGYWPTAAEAIVAWNRRPGEAVAVEKLADILESMLDESLATPERKRNERAWGWIEALEHAVGIARLRSRAEGR